MLYEVITVYPHARSLVVLICEENKAAMQSRYLPTANHELYESEERLFRWNHEVLRYVQSLGGAGLTTTVGWPQEVSVRWSDNVITSYSIHYTKLYEEDPICCRAVYSDLH